MLQITRTTRLRRMMRHFWQMRRTEGRTFMQREGQWEKKIQGKVQVLEWRSVLPWGSPVGNDRRCAPS